MSGIGMFPLQKAVYQVLIGDAPLMGLVSGVYNFVPQAAGYPYLTIGEVLQRDWSTTTTTGAACSLTIRVFSREGGRKQTATIMDRVHALLHQGGISVEGYTAVLSRFESAETRLEDDGATYQGIMKFRVLLQG
jgi:hypothetical protein